MAEQSTWWTKNRAYAAATISSVALLGGAAGETAFAQPEATSGLADCAAYLNPARYHNHEYEVCTAYVANSAEVALQGYYKFGRSPRLARANLARHHFESRYFNGPRRIIEKRVNSWPVSENDVSEDIDITGLSVSLNANRALVTTREDWLVAADNGRTLYQEHNRRHEITMCKIEGLVLHKWVVVKFTKDPNFNCGALSGS